MYKKLTYLATLVLVLALASNASAITHTWTGLGDGSSWGDSDNWDGDGTDSAPYVPSLPAGGEDGDTVMINYYSANDVNVVIDGYAAVCRRAYATNCTWTIKNGGSLTVAQKARLDTSGGGTNGTFNLYDGSIVIPELAVADEGGSCTLNLLHANAVVTCTGTASDQGLWVADDTVSVGHVQLNAGMIRTTILGNRGTATMDIAGGTLVLDGEVTALSFATAHGGDADWFLVFDYNDVTITTTITAACYLVARDPSPANDVNYMAADVVLSWTPGWFAADSNGHDVYLGIVWGDVNDANTASDPNVYMGRQDANSYDTNDYDPCGLEYNTTYYWRIDEVNQNDGNSPWKGDVWKFTVEPPWQVLTVKAEPNVVDINTIEPNVGQHNYYQDSIVDVNAATFVKCPDTYLFQYWEGPVADSNLPYTTITMDVDRTITAVFDPNRVCGDKCHPILQGDLNRDCEINFEDFVLYSAQWFVLHSPEVRP